MIARQIPDDSYWPVVILSPQIKYFLDDLSGRLVGRIFRNRFGILQASFTMLLVCITPPVKAGPADAKIPASFAGIADLLRVLKHLKFALNVAFFVRHEYFLHPKSGNLQEVSQESVHIYRLEPPHYRISGAKNKKCLCVPARAYSWEYLLS